jgi:signal transduction histidine kinase
VYRPETDASRPNRTYPHRVSRVPRPPLLDLGLAAVAVLLTSFAVASSGDSNLIGTAVAGPWWVRLLYPLGLGLPLAFRRLAPLGAVGVIVATLVLQGVVSQDTPEGFELIFVFCVAAYSVAAWSSRGRALAGLALLLGGYAVYAAENRDIRTGRPSELWAGAFFASMVVGMWLIGAYVGHRREERRARAATESELRRAQEAVEHERARLARELHDVIAHNLSVVVVQAAGARAAGLGDDETLGRIESTGRESLVEMRRLLGVLRQPPDDELDLAPQPGVADLATLVDRVRGSGLQVELDVRGDLEGLPTTVGLCIYRIVQESLTNVLKHAPTATARVHVEGTPDTVVVEVADDGPGDRGPGDGLGLIGMGERVEVFGGELTVGTSASSGGFVVRAVLPRTEAPSGGVLR